MMKTNNTSSALSALLKDASGGIAMMFGLMLPIMLGAVGLSLDYAQAYLVQQRLSQALDAAALAAAASSTDPATIEARVNAFFAANYPPEVLGLEFDPVVEVIGNEVRISGSAQYTTMFVKYLGIDDIEVAARATVQREVRGLEVVMVLDNTGSMAGDMDTLKQASEDFVNIIFNAALEEDDVKIGMVPYSSTVNLGSYAIGENPDGTTYGDGTVLVTLPGDVTYTDNPDSTSNWNGCVVEHKNTNYQSGATAVSNSRGQLWRYDGRWDGHGWNPGSGSNDPTPNDTSDAYEGPWDIYMYGKVITNGNRCTGSGYSYTRCSSCNPHGWSSDTRDKCNTSYCFCAYSDVNVYCPEATIMPLSSDRDALIEHIDRMHAEGATVPTPAMNWGFRLLSPEEPFTEGAAWNSEHWQKAILLMTDGETSMGGDMTAYWASAKNNISNATLNTRLTSLCTLMKNADHNIKIYTVIFGNLDVSTRAVYQGCATSPAYYFEALDQDELVEVFNDIARDLANLHLSE